jgi:hypothetical protein
VVKSGPVLPGGKRADLAVGMGKSWTYIEVKTRSNAVATRERRLSFRQDLLREILRLRAHSLRQLPKKQASEGSGFTFFAFVACLTGFV